MEVNTAEDIMKEINRNGGGEKRKTHSTEVVKRLSGRKNWRCVIVL